MFLNSVVMMMRRQEDDSLAPPLPGRRREGEVRSLLTVAYRMPSDRCEPPASSAMFNIVNVHIFAFSSIVKL
jgi:hypothetical protein